MNKDCNEKQSLIRAIVLSLALIVILAISAYLFAAISAYLFASEIAEPPEYSYDEMREIITALDNSIWQIDKKEKAAIEEMFGISDVERLEFQRSSENSVDMILSDGKTGYVFKFSVINSKIVFNNSNTSISLFMVEDTLLFQDSNKEILEIKKLSQLEI